MQAKRDLRRYAAEAKQAIETLFASDLADLSYVDEPKPVVVALMTCIRMLWPAGQGPPKPAGADCYRWPRVRRRIRRPHFLPRLRNLADAAMAEVLQIPTRRVRAVKVFYDDPGKYSKRRRSNVAVIIVRILFISSFLFYCLLCNHSFQTNPNRITNCFQLVSLLQLYNYIAPAFPLFLFLNSSKKWQQRNTTHEIGDYYTNKIERCTSTSQNSKNAIQHSTVSCYYYDTKIYENGTSQTVSSQNEKKKSRRTIV